MRSPTAPATSELDDIFIYWWHASGGRVARRAVLRDYAGLRCYLPRLLRYLDAELPAEELGRELLALRERGSMVSVVFGVHCLGLGRPHLLGDRGPIDRADPPFLICREPAGSPFTPCFPLLVPSREAAVKFVRRLDQRCGIDVLDWRAYTCERLAHSTEPFRLGPTSDGPTGFLTELERQLAAAVRRD